MLPETFSVTVVGRPAPQGSKKYVGNNRFVEASKYLPAWRKAIVDACQAQTITTFTTAVVCVVFVFIDKPASVTLPYPTSIRTGDADKHARSIGDALTISGVVADDSLIVDFIVHKRWAQGVEPGALITVYEKENNVTS